MFIVLIILSMHAFIGYSFLVKICKWAMYFTQKAGLQLQTNHSEY